MARRGNLAPRAHGLSRQEVESAAFAEHDCSPRLREIETRAPSKTTRPVHQKTTGLTFSKTVRCSQGLEGQIQLAAECVHWAQAQRLHNIFVPCRRRASARRIRWADTNASVPALTRTDLHEEDQTRASPTAPQLAPLIDLARHRLRRWYLAVVSLSQPRRSSSPPFEISFLQAPAPAYPF